MSGRKKKADYPACSLLQPAVLFGALGSYIAVTCGSLSGNSYLSRIIESNQSQSKCILVSSKWYSSSSSSSSSTIIQDSDGPHDDAT